MALIVERLALRAAGVAVALLTYYSLEWLAIRNAMRDVVVWVLGFAGPVLATGTWADPGLRFAGRDFAFTRNCAYVDVVLVLAPLLWRPAMTLRANLLRLLALTAGAVAFNVIRIVIAIETFAVRDMDWRLVHFWPDYIFHVAIITGATLLAVRSDDRDGAPRVLAPRT